LFVSREKKKGGAGGQLEKAFFYATQSAGWFRRGGREARTPPARNPRIVTIKKKAQQT